MKDLTNKKFGDLIVLKRDFLYSKKTDTHAYWICKCKCGKIISVRGTVLRAGKVISCGCSKKIDITNNEEEHRKKLGEYYDIQGRVTVPQIIIGGKRIGGFDVLEKLENSGQLDSLLDD